MIWLLLLILVAAGLIYLIPFMQEQRRPEMDDTARVDAPGHFAELSQGVTHYQWFGGVRGPVAVCVHGLTTPGFVWSQIAEELAEMGYRVLTYDLYGRGFSDRPGGRQDIAFFIRQLEDLLEDQQIADDITLFGYSMGGAITAGFAAKNPHMLRQLVLVAPAGFGGFPTGNWQRMRDLPVIGDWMAHALLPKWHRAAAAKLGQDNPQLDRAAAGQAAQLDWKGFIPAVLSSLRHALRDEREADHRKISRVDVPVLAIWAEKDEAIPLSGMGKLTMWNRVARQTQIEGATHWLPLTHPKQVVAAFRDGME
ncbi:alpha/beta fold hydrolase [Pseudooceanicola sp. C21-150M6]|uniref:alpha/beta fold hydrolase n=1 Tax=Pseudooceanicola sp. C21-150M6 TaxID=3434355 RepID=UPI003D7FAFBF